MKNKINFLYLLFSLLMQSIFAQTPNRTKQKMYEDSMQLKKFKQDDPSAFSQNVMPLKLSANNFFVVGFFSGLKVSNAEITDSVYRNYYPNMPDTSTVKPYASFSVIGNKVNVDFVFHPLITNGIKYEVPEFKQITSTNDIDKILLPNKKNITIEKNYSIRITTNGKVLIDWSNIVMANNKVLYEITTTLKDKSASTKSYQYLYSLGSISLNKINDQILIEIKDNKTGWLMDSYNITRIAKTPTVNSFINSKTQLAYAVNIDNTLKKK